MSTENFKSHVGAILGLPDHLQPYWDILESYPEDNPQLVLAHYNDKYDPFNRTHIPLKKIRGTIIDLVTGAIIADSYGHTQTLPCFEPLKEDFSPDIPTGQIQVETEIAMYLNDSQAAPTEAARLTVGTRSFDSSRTQLFLGYEGAVLRFFKWRGQVFTSTHRRINASQSHWGGRDRFIDIFKRLGGPDPETLFGEEEYSPYCHLFLVVDNQIRLASSTRDNRIIYLGVKKVWSEEIHAKLMVTKGLPLESSQIGPYSHFEDISVRYPHFGEGIEPGPFSSELNRSMIDQPSINVDLANKFMFPSQFAANIPSTPEAQAYQVQPNELIIEYDPKGSAVREIYFPHAAQEGSDARLRGGDFVILYYQEANGETTVYRLEPETFQYRAKVMDDNPNLYNRFVVKLAEFVTASPQELIDEYPRYDGGDDQELRLDEISGRQVYWWSLFHDAAAPAYKDQIDKFFENYQQDINALATFIVSDYPHMTDPEELKRINENTQKRFSDLRTIAMNATRTQKRAPHSILRNLLYKETGLSAYKMISTLRGIHKYRLQKSRPAAESSAEPSLSSPEPPSITVA